MYLIFQNIAKFIAVVAQLTGILLRACYYLLHGSPLHLKLHEPPDDSLSFNTKPAPSIHACV